MTPLFTGIYDEFTGSTLATQIGGRFFPHEALQGAEFPYVVYSLISDTTDYVMCPSDGAMNFDDIIIQFDLFSKKHGNDSTEVGTMFTNLKAIYDWTRLTVAGYANHYMRRDFSHLARDIDEKIWQYTVQYRVFLEA